MVKLVSVKTNNWCRRDFFTQLHITIFSTKTLKWTELTKLTAITEVKLYESLRILHYEIRSVALNKLKEFFIKGNVYCDLLSAGDICSQITANRAHAWCLIRIRKCTHVIDGLNFLFDTNATAQEKY